MAKTEKRKKLNKGKLAFFLIFVILIIILGVYLYNSIFAKMNVKTQKVKISDEIKEFGYVLEDNETDLYKKYFNQLSKTLNVEKEDIDYDKYAELVSKLFVADFYNLENKTTKNDVGGLQFIHEDMQDNFSLKAKDTMYKNIKSNVYGDRKQELPEVKDITMDDIESDTFTYNDTEYDSINVTLSWEYKKDLGYDDEKIFTLIKDGDKLWLVESNPISESEDE